MKNFLSVILAIVLVIGVGGSLVSGTMAAFFDFEVSTDNHMQSGVRMIEIDGDPMVVYSAVPDIWYEQQMSIVNVGTLDGSAWLHILNLVSIEDQIGSGEATTEPELATEEGGVVGEDAAGTSVYVPGLGVDCGDEALGPADLVLANFIDV